VFTSAVVEVEQQQTVVDTGPYAIVRHPMYAGVAVLLAGATIALGSLWSTLAVALLLATIVWRLLDEERVLGRHLSGYDDYRSRVRYRLVPGIW
jgi:protein-S-isoprenylcysteine O-methyltransferase Ste14